MKPVILSADSTCDLGQELKKRYQVKTCPFHVELDGKSYEDGVNLDPDTIYQVYGDKKILPKTSAINIADYEEAFRRWTKDGYEVVHITLGHGLSSAYQNCCIAAGEMPGVYVVDSKSLSTGSGLLVLEAAERIQAGMEAKQVAQEVQALTDRVSASFVIDTLEFLYKGGRCSALQMLGANLLSLKPSIVVNHEDGSMSVGKKYRGTLDKALLHYVKDQLGGRTDIEGKRAFITHSGISEERLSMVKKAVEQTGLFGEIFVTRAGCTISSHCGPNTLGVLFMTKEKE